MTTEVFMKKRDIAIYVKDFFNTYDNLSEERREELFYHLRESSAYRELYRKELHEAFLKVIVKIVHALKTNNFENSGFTCTECSSITMRCVKLLKWASLQEKLSERDEKEVKMCRMVLPYLYENMQVDKNLTTEVLRRWGEELYQLKIDKSCLNNAKKVLNSFVKNDNCMFGE